MLARRVSSMGSDPSTRAGRSLARRSRTPPPLPIIGRMRLSRAGKVRARRRSVPRGDRGRRRSLGSRLDRERLPDLRRRRADDALRRLAARVREPARPGRPARARARRQPLSPVRAGPSRSRWSPTCSSRSCSSPPSACSRDAGPCRSAVACAGALALGIVTNPYTLGSLRGADRGGRSWLFAARDAQRGRVLRAGLLVGHLRGIRAVRDPRDRRARARPGPARGRSRRPALAVGVLAIQFAPFALGGRLPTCSATAGTSPAGRSASSSPARLRLAAARAPGDDHAGDRRARSIARRVRWIAAAVFIVPAAAAIVRLSIDPMGTYYYWDTPLVIELVGVAAALANLDAIRAWVGLRFGRVAATVSTRSRRLRPCASGRRRGRRG